MADSNVLSFTIGQAVKTVGDPNAEYESMLDTWRWARCACSGEQAVKEHDSVTTKNTGKNFLIPFSPTMSDAQYAFYRQEAEWPGISSQFSHMMAEGLLRKQPELKLPDGLPTDAYDWIMHQFGRDDSSLTAFLDAALWEEIQTSRAWIFVDYPEITEPEKMSSEDFLYYKPFPILQKAESIINWRTREDYRGKMLLDRVIVRGMREVFKPESEFHPYYKDTVWVHELNDAGFYRVRMYERVDETAITEVRAGEKQASTANVQFNLVKTIENIQMGGKPLKFIPAWPLNGNIDIIQPVLTPIINKEKALYNKMSRRNHLLYGASTYTPVAAVNMTDDQFDDMVERGLGTWIKIEPGETITALETPTDALADMEKAIAANVEEIAKLGVRMLAPEVTQPGVALELRNAAQTARMGSINSRVSSTMRQVIAFMLSWRYGLDLPAYIISFSLSPDFDPLPLGEGWLRLATEWYENTLIPRSVWLQMLKHNDIIPPDYDDEVGRAEIAEDVEAAQANMPSEEGYLNDLEKQQEKE